MPRHREFDPEKALEAAMRLFWQKGYEGASYADLSAATGVARPGLYAAFGDKRTLFLKALDLYERQEMAFMRDALNRPSALEVIETLLRQSAKANLQPGKPHGCLGINGALACAEEGLPIQAELNRRRAVSLRLLEERLKRAQKEGDLPITLNASALARFMATLMQGVAVQAKAGVAASQIRSMLDLVMQLLQSLKGL